jgi:hypothetical protein
MNIESADKLLSDFVNRMIHASGKNLESVILFGSAAHSASAQSAADLNTFVTLKSTSPHELKAIAPVLVWWTQEIHQPGPQIFASGELAAAADVFAIEFCDMQSSHKVLFGPDVIADLKIPMNLHRVQVEHELRTTILKLRQLYLRSSGDAKLLSDVLAKSLSSAKTLLRHALITLDKAAPGTETALYEAAAKAFDLNTVAFANVARLKNTPAAAADLDSIFGEYLTALEAVTHKLDKILPKSEWKRFTRNPEMRNV